MYTDVQHIFYHFSDTTSRFPTFYIIQSVTHNLHSENLITVTRFESGTNQKCNRLISSTRAECHIYVTLKTVLYQF